MPLIFFCRAFLGGSADLGSTEVTLYCRTYEPTWVFNIADFVTYLWSINNSGAKPLQVRFYPRKS